MYNNNTVRFTNTNNSNTFSTVCSGSTISGNLTVNPVIFKCDYCGIKEESTFPNISDKRIRVFKGEHFKRSICDDCIIEALDKILGKERVAVNKL